MNSKRLFLTILPCLSMSVLALAQSAPVPDTIAKANVIQMTRDLATIQITNTSNKNIAAYTVAIEEVYQDGQINHHQRSSDDGPNIEVLAAPGHSVEEPDTLTNFPNNPVVTVNAKLLVVVFSDRTAYVANDDAFQRIVNNRRAAAAAGREAIDIIQKAVDSQDPNPSRLAADELRHRATESHTSQGPPVALSVAVDSVQNAPAAASRLHISERDYLKQLLGRLRTETSSYTEQATIKKVN